MQIDHTHAQIDSEVCKRITHTHQSALELSGYVNDLAAALVRLSKAETTSKHHCQPARASLTRWNIFGVGSYAGSSEEPHLEAFSEAIIDAPLGEGTRPRRGEFRPGRRA